MDFTSSVLKNSMAVIATILAFVAFLPYFRSIFQNKTTPHFFSWLIWGISMFAVFFAQYAGKGGIGTISTGVSGLISLFIAVLAYFRRSDITIYRADWVYLILSLSALPIWYFTADPLWAVVILTFTDVLGFLPTFRKAYEQPFSENLTFYLLIVCRNICTMIALEFYSMTTLLFPIVLSITGLLLVLMATFRRKQLSANNIEKP